MLMVWSGDGGVTTIATAVQPDGRRDVAASIA